MDRQATANRPADASEVQLLAFLIDSREFCLRVSCVVHVARMVAITPAPLPDGAMTGWVNVRGFVMPVISGRLYFGCAERPASPDDHLLIVSAGEQVVALAVDELHEVFVATPAQISSTSVGRWQAGPRIRGVAKCGAKLVPILDEEALAAIVPAQPGRSAHDVSESIVASMPVGIPQGT